MIIKHTLNDVINDKPVMEDDGNIYATIKGKKYQIKMNEKGYFIYKELEHEASRNNLY